MLRKTVTLTAAALSAGALVLGLAACAPQASSPGETAGPDAGESPALTCAPAGAVSDGIEITGDFGAELAWDFSEPIAITEVERTVAIEGEAAPQAAPGQTVMAFYTVFDGESGEVIERSLDIGPTAVPFVNDAELFTPGIVAALTCATPGSRIVTVMPAIDAFGENVAALSLADELPIVLVLDVETIEETQLPEAAPRDARIERPAVDLSGPIPAVTLPESAPPTEVEITVLEAGDGPTVEPGATVTLDYRGLSWDSGFVFDSSYEAGQPATFSTDGVIPGFRDAIVGQQVGSTLVVSIPPEQAYGTDPAGHQLGGQTLVFVIHIISVQ